MTVPQYKYPFLHSLSTAARCYSPVMFIVLFGISLSSCHSADEHIPDVSAIKVELHTARFDKDLYALDTNNLGAGLQKLHAQYPDFLDYYLDTVMAYGIRGNFNDTVQGVREGLRVFLTFRDFKGLEDTIKKYYPDSKETDAMLTDGFKFLKYYFPDFNIPRIYYVNMGLSNWPCFPVDNRTLCIGLDMFLGEQFPHYKSVGVPEYMFSHMRKAYMPVSVFATIYKSIHPFTDENRTLLDLMSQRGKEQYYLHHILPHAPDSLLFGFTALQLEWCRVNEAGIYNFFIRQNLLYSKEPQAIIPYVKDGPFAKDLEPPSDKVKSSPGNIGAWLGYKIVLSYMEQHPKTTLRELLDLQTEPAKFLEEARYKPKK